MPLRVTCDCCYRKVWPTGTRRLTPARASSVSCFSFERRAMIRNREQFLWELRIIEFLYVRNICILSRKQLAKTDIRSRTKGNLSRSDRTSTEEPCIEQCISSLLLTQGAGTEPPSTPGRARDRVLCALMVFVEMAGFLKSLNLQADSRCSAALPAATLTSSRRGFGLFLLTDEPTCF